MQFILNPLTGNPYSKNNKYGTKDEYKYFRVIFTQIPNKLTTQINKKILNNLENKIFFSSPFQYEHLTGNKVSFEIKEKWKNYNNIE